MTRIFFDTEFTSLTQDAKLISIGLVDESGQRSFYAELSNTWQLADVSEFAKQEVIPLLEGLVGLGGDAVMTMHQLAGKLHAWIKGLGEPVMLATDSLQWDWPWILALFRDHWPENLSTEPLLLTMNYLDDFDGFEAAIQSAYRGESGSGLRRHHALDDAKANRIGWIAAGGDILM